MSRNLSTRRAERRQTPRRRHDALHVGLALAVGGVLYLLSDDKTRKQLAGAVAGWLTSGSTPPVNAKAGQVVDVVAVSSRRVDVDAPPALPPGGPADTGDTARRTST